MHFSLTSPSVWYDIFLIAAIVKFTCVIISARWPGGAEVILDTGPGRFVYFAGKITPLIAIGAVLIYYKLIHPSIDTWWLVLVFVALLFYDAYVVWLRLTNRWYGLGQNLKSRESQNDD